MTYIESISDPKILKLGFKWALYREKKPLVENTQMNEYYQEKWQETRIAYLKELPWKLGNMIWYNKKRLPILEFSELRNWVKLAIGIGKFIKVPLNECSHYYPGQQYDGEVTYVRECENPKKGDRVIHKDSLTSGIIDAVHENSIYIGKIGFTADELWQEVEVPLMRLGVEDQANLINNPKYTQFQEDVDKGIILAVTKQ